MYIVSMHTIHICWRYKELVAAALYHLESKKELKLKEVGFPFYIYHHHQLEQVVGPCSVGIVNSLAPTGVGKRWDMYETNSCHQTLGLLPWMLFILTLSVPQEVKAKEAAVTWEVCHTILWEILVYPTLHQLCTCTCTCMPKVWLIPSLPSTLPCKSVSLQWANPTNM